MPVSDIIQHPALNGLHEAQVLGAGAQSRTDLSVVEYEETGNASNKVLLHSGRVVSVGDVFVRPAYRGIGTDAEADAEFSWFGGSNSVRGADKVRLVEEFEHTTIGEQFKNPATMPVFIGGVRATWDGPGLQDPWTAETLPVE